jgi:hypothetical protein
VTRPALRVVQPGEAPPEVECESCRQRPARVQVTDSSGAWFAVCDDCIPPEPTSDPTARPDGGADEIGDGFRLDRFGRGHPFLTTLLPPAAAATAFLLAGRGDTGLAVMVAVGVVTGAAAVRLDHIQVHGRGAGLWRHRTPDR